MAIRRLIGFVLLCIFSLQLLGHTAMAVRFQLHHDCEEKEVVKHISCCNGACELSKELRDEQQREQQSIKKIEKQPDLLSTFTHHFEAAAYTAPPPTPLDHSPVIFDPHYGNVFHPPII